MINGDTVCLRLFLESEVTKLTVREFRPSDIESIVRYFYDAPAADLERMGVEASRLPPEDDMRASLAEVLKVPAGEGPSCYLIWEVDGRAIGHASLKDIIPRECGGMHLHMWDDSCRGKGIGGELFCRAALEFYRLYDLPMIVCEPRAANPMPNRMLQKIGFPLVRTYRGASSSLSAVTELNRYEIRREIVERCLGHS
jgi:RimJ/RimL family protein N-acetyltransferase